MNILHDPKFITNDREATIADEVVMNKIYQIRGHEVMLDMDLAEL